MELEDEYLIASVVGLAVSKLQEVADRVMSAVPAWKDEVLDVQLAFLIHP